MNKTTELYRRFKNQHEKIRNLIGMYWFYAFIVGLTDIFGSVMMYDITKDEVSLVIFTIIRFFGLYFSFLIYAILVREYKLNLKYYNILYISSLILSFAALYFSNSDTTLLYIFVFIYGIATGFFWVGQHNYVLKTLDVKNSDIYSSILGVGKEVNTVLVPAVAVISFYTSEYILGWGTYDVYAIVLITSTLAMGFGMGKFNSLRVKKASVKKFKDHLKEEKYIKEIIVYNMARSFKTPILILFASYVALEALKTPINIGIVEVITSIITLYVSIWISSVKHSSNRLQLMLVSMLIYSLSFVFLIIMDVSAIAYIIFTFFSIIVNPLFKTTERLIDIRTMDMLYSEDSYHLGILFRETIVFISHMLMGLLLMLLFMLENEVYTNVVILGILSIMTMLIQYMTASRMYKNNMSELSMQES